jgi:hypothetical protein
MLLALTLREGKSKTLILCQVPWHVIAQLVKSLQWTRVTVNVAASTDAPMPSEHGQSLSRPFCRVRAVNTT